MHETFSSSISCLSAGLRLGGACMPVGGKFSGYVHCRYISSRSNFNNNYYNNGKDVLRVFFFSDFLRIIRHSLEAKKGSLNVFPMCLQVNICASLSSTCINISFCMHLAVSTQHFFEFSAVCSAAEVGISEIILVSS